MGEKFRILCYGDSNTWGYISDSDHQRHSKTERWTGVLQNMLGDNFEIIEEGLNGRTLISIEAEEKEGMELNICSHALIHMIQ